MAKNAGRGQKRQAKARAVETGLTDQANSSEEVLPSIAVADPDPSGPEKDVIRQQLETRDQIRYVREFMTNPLFMDLGESAINTSSQRCEIEQRKSDLNYKVRVLEAILNVHKAELKSLDRLITEDDDAASDASKS